MHDEKRAFFGRLFNTSPVLVERLRSLTLSKDDLSPQLLQLPTEPRSVAIANPADVLRSTFDSNNGYNLSYTPEHFSFNLARPPSVIRSPTPLPQGEPVMNPKLRRSLYQAELQTQLAERALRRERAETIRKVMLRRSITPSAVLAGELDPLAGSPLTDAQRQMLEERRAVQQFHDTARFERLSQHFRSSIPLGERAQTAQTEERPRGGRAHVTLERHPIRLHEEGDRPGLRVYAPQVRPQDIISGVRSSLPLPLPGRSPSCEPYVPSPPAPHHPQRRSPCAPRQSADGVLPPLEDLPDRRLLNPGSPPKPREHVKLG